MAQVLSPGEAQAPANPVAQTKIHRQLYRVTGGLIFVSPDRRAVWISIWLDVVFRFRESGQTPIGRRLIPKAELQDSAVNTVWSRVVRLVKKPEPVPLTSH